MHSRRPISSASSLFAHRLATVVRRSAATPLPSASLPASVTHISRSTLLIRQSSVMLTPRPCGAQCLSVRWFGSRGRTRARKGFASKNKPQTSQSTPDTTSTDASISTSGASALPIMRFMDRLYQTKHGGRVINSFLWVHRLPWYVKVLIAFNLTLVSIGVASFDKMYEYWDQGVPIDELHTVPDASEYADPRTNRVPLRQALALAWGETAPWLPSAVDRQKSREVAKASEKVRQNDQGDRFPVLRETPPTQEHHTHIARTAQGDVSGEKSVGAVETEALSEDVQFLLAAEREE